MPTSNDIMKLIASVFFTCLIINQVLLADPKTTQNLDEYITSIYQILDKNEFELPPFDLYELGIIGYINLKAEKKVIKKDIITLIDFRLSSNKRRLWVVDLNQNKILFHTVVSHGKNTGEEYAKYFSNSINSNKSSVGFYITGETYFGKHGLSLRLDGQETGFNDNARKRAVVMHSAAYATRDFAKTYGRLGRSFGCPAIPKVYHKQIINQISNKSILFIYYPLEDYNNNSRMLDRANANTYLSNR